ncbi:MAG TPA: hypothetical protein VI391_06855, partial [Thermoanaerobaculia bacterium]
AFAPFHAMRIPDAGNVVSWFFGALLIGFVYALVARVTSSRVWAAFCAAAVLTGMYTPVWHVASNAYAIGDLGVTAAVIALYLLPDLVAQAGRSNVMLSFSILSIAAASSKISLFPIAGVLTLLAFVRMLRENRGDAARLLAAAVLPPLLVMGPLLVWTFIASGSPFGPLLAGRFGPSIYDVARIRGFLDNYVGGSRGPIPEKLRNAIVEDSPLIWIGIAAFMFWKRVRVERAIGIALLALQVLLIAGWMTLDVRYLAGVHYALAILAAIFLSADIREKLLRPRTLVLLTAVFIVPWFALQAVYATPFVRFLASGESLSHFCAERVGFFDDYLSLDRRVGGDAVLFAYPFAMSSFYAPRPILYDPDDLPAGRPVYLLTFNAMFESDPQPSVPRGFRAGPMIYENRNAVVAAFREPGREPRRGVVRAWRLDRAKGQS